MKYTNRYNLPAHIVEAVTKQTYDLNQTDKTIISVTGLNNPPRIRQLTLRHWNNIVEDVSDGIWRLLGGAVHEVMQRISDKDRFIEERLKEPLCGMTISGKADLYDGTTESIEDYKITSVWAVKREKIEWVNQLNSYAWFYRKLGFKVNHAYINAILRDWRKGEFKRSKIEYPPIAFKRVKVSLKSFEEQEQYIKDRIEIHQKASELPDDKLPLCTDEERWSGDKRKDIRCQEYCNVCKFCSYWKEHYEKEIKKDK